VLHGEHCRRYDAYGAMHYLTDGTTKYVWHSATGDELLFDLIADPHEEHNLVATSGAAGRLSTWRRRLVETLRDRPEGFVAGNSLVPGRPHHPTVPR
jgi:hypothetical protein